MKIIIFGAAGNMGKRLATQAVTQGYDISLVARNLGKLAEHFAPEFLEAVKTYEVDSMDKAAVGQAMQGHEVAINAAGNVLTMGNAFPELFDIFVTQAEQHLIGARRIWAFGGAAILTIPYANVLGIELPAVPKAYKYHLVNYNRLQRSPLDWSMICPGPMLEAEDGILRDDLRISTDLLPYKVGKHARFLPKIALALMMKRRLPQLIVSYEDVANIMLTHMESKGPFSRKRVGVALPLGETAKKEGWEPTVNKNQE